MEKLLFYVIDAIYKISLKLFFIVLQNFIYFFSSFHNCPSTKTQSGLFRNRRARRLSLDLVRHLEELQVSRLHLRVHTGIPRLILQLLSTVSYNVRLPHSL